MSPPPLQKCSYMRLLVWELPILWAVLGTWENGNVWKTKATIAPDLILNSSQQAQKENIGSAWAKTEMESIHKESEDGRLTRRRRGE